MGLLWLATWLVAYSLLSLRWEYAERWVFLSGAVLILLWLRVRQHLDLNSRPGQDTLLPRLGPGNQVTVFRGLLLGLLAGFLFSPWPAGGLAWLIAGIYTVASLADAVDGYVARRRNEVTELGQFLDMEFDGLGLALVSLLAIGYGQLPLWFLLVGLARYFFVFGLWVRERGGKSNYAIPASVQRRIMAGMLMGMMTVILWPIVPPEMCHIAALVMGIPLLLGFTRDWLFASGRLAETDSSYQQLRRWGFILLTRWLPPLWRLLLVVAMFTILSGYEPWYRPGAWEALLQSWGLPFASILGSLLVLVAVAGSIGIALGALGRLWAVLLLFPIGFDISTAGLTWQNGLALVCALLITLFGSGPFSLWRPEEAFLVHRGGQPAGPPEIGVSQ